MKFRSSVSRPLFSAGIVLLGLCATRQAQADDYYVTNTNDSGPGSLRQAITDSNNSVGGDLILFDSSVFSTPQTISALSPYPGFTGETTIIGPDSSLLTVSGLGVTTSPSSLFTVNSGAAVTIGGFSGSNVRTIITNSGQLTVKDSVLTKCRIAVNNTAQGRAVMLNCNVTVIPYTPDFSPTGRISSYDVYNSGSLTAIGCAFQGPNPDAPIPLTYGIYNYSSATANVRDCTFINNHAGISNDNSSRASVTDSTFIGSSYGMEVFGTSSADVSNSTFVLARTSSGINNGASLSVVGCAFHPYPSIEDSKSGPGINNFGTATIFNSTFAGGHAGLESLNPGTARVANCTFCRNGYGIEIVGGAVTLLNSLVVGNTDENIRWPLASGSSNNITTGTPAEAGLQVDGSGNAVLQYNGGGTQTFALVRPRGTAVNTGSLLFISKNIPYDQRGQGYSRWVGQSVDVGAFEFQLPVPTSTPAPTPTPSNTSPSSSQS